MIRPLCLLAALAGVSACADREPAVTDVRGQLDRIATKCGLPKTVFELRSPEDLHFRPGPEAKYESVDCAIVALRKAKLPLKVGFVGNGAFVGGNSQ